jgi:hypothetical protein
MSTLVVVNYDDPYKAEEVRLKLRKLQSEYLLDLEDAVVAVKDEKGKVKLHLVTLTGAGAVSGGFWGMLIGTDLLEPTTRVCDRRRGRCGFRRAHRSRDQRSFYEGAGRDDDSWQFNSFRAGKKSHAGQGARRAEGNRRQNLEDFALSRGRN